MSKKYQKLCSGPFDSGYIFEYNFPNGIFVLVKYKIKENLYKVYSNIDKKWIQKLTATEFVKFLEEATNQPKT